MSGLGLVRGSSGSVGLVRCWGPRPVSVEPLGVLEMASVIAECSNVTAFVSVDVLGFSVPVSMTIMLLVVCESMLLSVGSLLVMLESTVSVAALSLP